MPRNKKLRRKVYNPARFRTHLVRKQAERCLLYRWESSTDPQEDYQCFGPYTPSKTVELLTWALRQPETWLCTIIACFVTPQGDYYEEMITLPPYGPARLVTNPQAWRDQVSAAIADARQSGNPQHYVDATVAMSLYTPAMNAQLDEDDWIKKQAGYRAEMILQQVT